MNETLYRQGIVVVFLNEFGRVLLGQRSDFSTECWQFPQGGIDDGEAAITALHREMKEELGIEDIVVKATMPTKTSYDFPVGRRRDGFLGQEHVWYVCRSKTLDNASLTQFDFSKTDGAFRALQWARPEDATILCPDFKRQAYAEALTHFGFVDSD